MLPPLWNINRATSALESTIVEVEDKIRNLRQDVVRREADWKRKKASEQTRLRTSFVSLKNGSFCFLVRRRRERFLSVGHLKFVGNAGSPTFWSSSAKLTNDHRDYVLGRKCWRRSG